MADTVRIGYREALERTLSRIFPLEAEEVPVTEAADRVLAEDCFSRVDSPSVDASLKDGFAVRSADVEGASSEHPVCLRITGTAAAGSQALLTLDTGNAVRVLTGAKIPDEADAVVPEELTRIEGDQLFILRDAKPGRNILPRGTDVARGKLLETAGQRIHPGLAGLLAAAGQSRVSVVRRPSVAILATGDEVVLPGAPLPEGKLFASNMVTLNGWCRGYGMATALDIAGDRREDIEQSLAKAVRDHDAVLTSGGAWTGDRDLMVRILEKMGWELIFQHLRMGPGKAASFGILQGKPVFVLPGGPPSNLMAFLQIALPGLMKLSGFKTPGLPEITVRLTETISGRAIDWTHFVFGRIQKGDSATLFLPLKGKSRLRDMARAEAVVAIPEGLERIPAGAAVPAQLLLTK